MIWLESQLVIKREILNCSICNNTFKRKKNYQLYCSEICEEKANRLSKEIDDRVFNTNCYECGITVRKPKERGGSSLCHSCKKSRQKKYYKPVIKDPEKKKKSISLDEQIRRMEWKRVWDDAGWDHYLSGKKYDRI